MTNTLLSPGKRIGSIDALRGIVMIIMALDHIRDYFHIEGLTGDPTNMATTTPQLFLTRFITHFCAPTFVFLAGTSGYLQGLKKSKPVLSAFLIKRGFWLIIVEFLIVSLGITFNPFYNLLVMQVIWAIGISMVILGILVRLPFAAILTIGLVIVLGHNLLDYAEAGRTPEQFNVWWTLLHRGRFATIPFAPNHFFLVVYPFVPWTGLMLLGYCFGKIYDTRYFDAAKRRKILIGLGSCLIVLFIMLRGINLYGDAAHWSGQKNFIFTILSFLNTTKYPPSLVYMCMTIGPSILMLALLEPLNNSFTSFVTVFGRVPLFYYVLHFYFIHLVLVIFFYLYGYGTKDIVTPNSPFLFRPPDFGFSLPFVYLIWISVILILYPICKWYNNYKSTHSQWWLSYL